jgi:iron(III) transport system substrate-binding protein
MTGRRAVLAGLALAGAGRAWAQPAGPTRLTDDLLDAAKREGAVTFYTTDDAALAEQLAKGFQAAYPTIRLGVEQFGAETLLRRMAEESKAGQRQADVVSSNDVRSLVMFRRDGWLLPYVPDAAQRWPEEGRDPAGFYAFGHVDLMVMGYNTKSLNAEQAPKGYADLIGLKWQGRLVKSSPEESGAALVSTFLMNRELGWAFWDRLAAQDVLQVKDSIQAPARVASGERTVMIDGAEAEAQRLRAAGAPLAVVYPKEGTPAVPTGTALVKDSPHPNAGRVLVNWLLGREAQQIVVNAGGRSFHPDVREPQGRPGLAATKPLFADPILLAAEAELVRQLYAQFFAK